MTLPVPHLPASRPQSAGVRPFVESDLAAVADLHRRVSGFASDAALADSYDVFFRDVFLRRSVPGVGPLVFEDAAGDIVGFQGIQPRPMFFEGRRITMAVCSHFIVDPARRGVPGIRLLKAVMDGRQDVTIADESNDTARRLWEWCGGSTALLYSMHWVRPLRLSESAVAILLEKRAPRTAKMVRPIARIVDAVCRRARFEPLRTFVPSGSISPLDNKAMESNAALVGDARALRPDYSDGSLSWLIERARTRTTGGEFRRMLVRDDCDRIVGWFIYFAKRGGIADVLQIAATPGAAGVVIDHLIADAVRHGVAALSGRLDPSMAAELSQRHCIFFRRGHWALVHARDRAILAALERGDAFLSRLEGEWCLRFQ